jgi:simple sugar transport system ATP-binding protein
VNSPPFLQAIGISKFFGAIRALSDVSMTINHGEVVGVVGDNAAGKSTFMKILSGAYQPDKGKILINGQHVQYRGPLEARRYGIEMIYQDFALVPELDVAANIFLGREIYRKILGLTVLRKQEMQTSAMAMIDSLGLDVPSPRARVQELSGGQQQAVAIARATGFRAKLVIMDEPTANLGASAIAKVREAITRLKDHGVAVVIISHRLEDVFTTADRVVVMKRGRIVGERQVSETVHDEILEMIITGKSSALAGGGSKNG